MFAPRLTVALMLCVSFAAQAEEPAAVDELKPPPGFRAKKRGDVVVYCRKETKLGSRFPAEKCYDQAGLRELRLAELEHTEMMERMQACIPGPCSVN